MAGQEKLLTGSPFTGPNAAAASTTCDLTRIRLVANGAPCTVTLYNPPPVGAPVDIITLDAAVSAPDEYVAAADRKLHFADGIQIGWSGTGKLYLYYT